MRSRLKIYGVCIMKSWKDDYSSAWVKCAHIRAGGELDGTSGESIYARRPFMDGLPSFLALKRTS